MWVNNAMDIKKILNEQKEKLDAGIADRSKKLASDKKGELSSDKKEELTSEKKVELGSEKKAELGNEKKPEISAPEKKAQISHEGQKEPKLVKESDVQRIVDLENQLKRVQAEFENYKKRTEKEKQMLMMAGSASMIMKLLPLFDEVEIAIGALHHKAEVKNIKQGMEMLHTKFHSVLDREGVSEMECLGKEFDPYMHEALRTVDADETGDGKVVEVMKKGYLYKGNVIRHAMVAVGRKKEEKIEVKTEEKIELENENKKPETGKLKQDT